MTLTIRQAGPADVPVVIEFNRLLAHESEGKTLDTTVLGPGVKAVLADSRKGLYFLAEEGGRFVGQMGLTFEWSDWRNGWFWWIQSVYVRPDARRQGVFRSLYSHIEDMAGRDQDVIGLRLYVEESNESRRRRTTNWGWPRQGILCWRSTRWSEKGVGDANRSRDARVNPSVCHCGHRQATPSP